jgi:hypothetical protein
VLSAVDGTSTDGLGGVDTLALLDSAKREAVAKHAAARSELFGDAPGEDGEGGTLLLWFTAPPEAEAGRAGHRPAPRRVRNAGTRFVCASAQPLGAEFAASHGGG